MKVKPIDETGAARIDPAKPAAKSRLKRLFERQFPGVLRTSTAEKSADGRDKERTDDGVEMEPSSVCLDKMVLSFMEEGGSERPPRSRCNCFNGNYEESSDEDIDVRSAGDPPTAADPAEFVKGLIHCASTVERNLLAEASKIMEKAKNWNRKSECRWILVEGLQSLGYNAAICKSQWDKSSTFPAGEYEYIDVMIEGCERLVVDVDFRSEFEIARSTKRYRAMLQHLPALFVSRPDRLQLIVAAVSEATRQSLRKKGLHVPPWRKPDYMRAKWLSPYTRADCPKANDELASSGKGEEGGPADLATELKAPLEASGGSNVKAAATEPWQPPPARPRSGARVVAGLTAVL